LLPLRFKLLSVGDLRVSCCFTVVVGTLSALVLVGLAASGWGVEAAPASRAPTVTIGGVQVPADCALAKKEHPRLLFTKADIPRLRARLQHPERRQSKPEAKT